jgi:hypothetical protein
MPSLIVLMIRADPVAVAAGRFANWLQILAKLVIVIHKLEDQPISGAAKNCLTRTGLTGCNRALFLQGFQS